LYTEEIRLELESVPGEVIAGKLLKLPQKVLSILQHASCIGLTFDDAVLCSVMAVPDTEMASHLQLASNQGLLLAGTGSHWEFSHDKIRDTLYNSMPTRKHDLIHLNIGRHLSKHFAANQLGQNIFSVVEQLLAGAQLVIDANEQVAVAELCLQAAEYSIQKASFQSALFYLLQGIALVKAQGWNRNLYLLSLNLHNHAIEVAFCIGQYDKVYSLVEIVLSNAMSLEDTHRSQATKIFALGSTDSGNEAIKYALKVLAKLNVKFPARPNVFVIFLSLKRLHAKLRKKSSESLLRLPLLENEGKLAAMQILSQIVFQAFIVQDARAVLMVVEMVNISVEYGICATSSIGFVLFGAFLCG
jgi:predicted ATPase